MFVGDHPVMWSGPVSNWIRACDIIAATGARWIVPGHGPVTDQSGVATMGRYLEHVCERATAAFHRGVPWPAAAVEIAVPGYEGWGHAERLAVTVGVIYRELGDPDAPTRPVMIDEMARLYWDHVGEAHTERESMPTAV
jgi:hypothetical protein